MTTATFPTAAPRPALAVVPGAPRQPLPFGLFSVLTFRPSGDGRWERGVTFEQQSCEPLSAYSDLDYVCPPDGDDPAAPSRTPQGSSYPTAESLFTVEAAYSCGIRPGSDEEQQALDRLYSREEQAAERELWEVLALTTTATVAATGPAAALASVEQALAEEYGSLGVIHMSRGTATLLVSLNLLEVRGSVLYTRLGTPVAAGGGYALDGTADDRELIGTPALFGYRSEADVISTFDRATNDFMAVASRRYLIGWDDCSLPSSTFTA